MGYRYCHGCHRKTHHGRNVGVGTLLLALCTAGLSLLLIPFYSKRCQICGKENDLASDAWEFIQNKDEQGNAPPVIQKSDYKGEHFQ